MSVPRDGLGAATVGGTIYAVGGFDGIGTYYNRVEAYDPATDTWVAKANLPTPRTLLAVVAMGGQVYAIGGYNGGPLGTVEVYDPSTDAWTARAPLLLPRYGLSAVAIGNTIYALSGEWNVASESAVEAYDPATNTWVARASLPTPRSRLGAGVIGGSIYAVGGYDGSMYQAVTEVYDPATDSWAARAPISAGKSGVGAAVVGGTLYLMGGIGPSATSVEAYDAATNRWAARSPLQTYRVQAGGAVANGVLYAIGGWGGSELATVEAGTLSAGLAAALAVIPASSPIGRWIDVVLTLTNQGGADAASVLPAIQLDAGSGLVIAQGTVTPPGPVTLASGAAVSFTWTYSVSGAGTVAFTATGDGTDTNAGGPVTAHASGALTTFFQPPILTGTLVAQPPPTLGWSSTVTLTVSNSGQLALTSIPAPALLVGGSVGTITSSPTGFPMTIPPGGTLVLTWTVTVTSPGLTGFSLSLTGVDAGSGASVTTFFSSGAPASVRVPGLNLVAIGAAPAAVGVDQPITVLLTVSNTGVFPLSNVQPARLILAGSGAAALEAGPVPPVVGTLVPGDAVTFAWTYRGARGGPVTFAGTATAPGTTPPPPLASNPVLVLDGAGDLKHLLVYPTPFRPGQAVGGTLKFRSMPPRTELHLYDAAGEKVRDLKADGFGYAEWDGRNTGGRRVAPGVYYFSAVPPDGKSRLGKVEVAHE